MNKNGQISLSIAEQIIYLWIKQYFEAGKVVNKDKSIGKYEFDITVPELKLLIDCNSIIENKCTSAENETINKKIEYTKKNSFNFIKIFNDGQSNDAVLKNGLLLFNLEIDEYMTKQVIPLLSYYINSKFGLNTSPDDIDEKLVVTAVYNANKVNYFKSFEKEHSDLAGLWNVERNYGCKPSMIPTDIKQEFWFTCPECGSAFLIKPSEIVKNKICKICKSFVVGEGVGKNECELINIGNRHGLISCFMLNNQKMEGCSYRELIITILSGAINNGKIADLLENKIIQGIDKLVTKGNQSYGLEIIDNYCVRVPVNISKQYELLLTIIYILDINVGNITVKLNKPQVHNIGKASMVSFPIKYGHYSGVVEHDEGCLVSNCPEENTNNKLQSYLLEMEMYSEMDQLSRIKAFDNLSGYKYTSFADREREKFILGIYDV